MKKPLTDHERAELISSIITNLKKLGLVIEDEQEQPAGDADGAQDALKHRIQTGDGAQILPSSTL